MYKILIVEDDDAIAVCCSARLQNGGMKCAAQKNLKM